MAGPQPVPVVLAGALDTRNKAPWWWHTGQWLAVIFTGGVYGYWYAKKVVRMKSRFTQTRQR